LIARIVVSDGVIDTCAEVIDQYPLLDTFQCRACRRNLGKNVDAITLSLHHPAKAANLTFNPAKAFETDVFGYSLHQQPIYPTWVSDASRPAIS